MAVARERESFVSCLPSVNAKSGGRSTAREQVLASVEYMRASLHLRLDIATLSARAGLSQSHYFAVFKQELGVPPLEFFTRMKVHRATELLAGTSDTVTGIATALGYADPLYFSKVFKDKIGVSPRQYRRRFRLASA
jgi:AraC-like DNA-binding protein